MTSIYYLIQHKESEGPWTHCGIYWDEDKAKDRARALRDAYPARAWRIRRMDGAIESEVAE